MEVGSLDLPFFDAWISTQFTLALLNQGCLLTRNKWSTSQRFLI